MNSSFKRIFISLVIAFTFISLGFCVNLAYAGEMPRFAYFSLEEIISKSKIGQQAQSRFRAEEERIRSRIQQKTSELENLRSELEKNAALLSKQAKEEKVKEFLKKKKAWEELTYQSKMKLNQLSNQMSSPIITRIHDIVKKIGERGKYTFIFEIRRGGIAYAPKSLNITDEIIKKLDKETKKGKMK